MAAPSRPEEGRGLPRSRRITRAAEIRAIFRRGKRSGTAHLDVFSFPSPVSHSRIGVVVPKHKHTIVERNLVKRRIREALRREILPQLEADGRMRDVLVRARREAYGVPYETLRDELTNWLERQWSHGRSSS